MGKVKIKYYFVKPSGRAYWRPTKKMRVLGFHLVPLGIDGPEAWALADEGGLDAVSMRAVAQRVGVTAMALYPFIEAWVTRDYAVHNICDRPRNRLAVDRSADQPRHRRCHRHCRRQYH